MLYLRLLLFIKKVMNKMRFPKYMKNIVDNLSYKYVEKRIISYLKKSDEYVKDDSSEGSNSDIIWLFWWQGYKSMPDIVKKSIDSIKYNSGGHKVILITQNNIFDYTNISTNILDKLSNGNITLTHFSDILRFNLLSNYGGLWIDSTVYCTAPITDDYFNNLYTSGGYHDIGPKFVGGRWTGFLIGGNSNNKLFRFMNCFFDIYWKDNDNLIQYFLIDYGLEYAYKKNIGGFKEYVDNVACHNNPNLFKMADSLNDDFDLDRYHNMISNTNMFKLTYKIKISKSEKTFYHKIISDDKLFQNNKI